MRKKELDYYRIVATPTPDGKRLVRRREYIGPRHTLLLDEDEQKKLTAKFIAASLGALVLHVAAALWQVPSNVAGAIGGPSMMVLVPMLFTAYGALNGLTVKNGDGMEQSKYRATSEYRRYGAAFSCLLLCYCFFACIVYTIIHRALVPLGKEALVCGEYLLAFLAFLWIWQTEKRLPYDRTEGERRLSDRERRHNG